MNPFAGKLQMLAVAGLVTFGLGISACSHAKQAGSMRNFGEDGQKSLAEVTDSDGRLWRILTMASGDVTTYFVYNSAGQIDIAAAAYKDRAGASHAFVSVDSAEKEAALGVLDRKFLSGLTGRSERSSLFILLFLNT